MKLLRGQRLTFIRCIFPPKFMRLRLPESSQTLQQINIHLSPWIICTIGRHVHNSLEKRPILSKNLEKKEHSRKFTFQWTDVILLLLLIQAAILCRCDTEFWFFRVYEMVVEKKILQWVSIHWEIFIGEVILFGVEIRGIMVTRMLKEVDINWIWHKAISSIVNYSCQLIFVSRQTSTSFRF